MLDLSNAPSTLFLYGLAGAGKNFVGDTVGRLAGWQVYHADVDLTPDMNLAIAEKRMFTLAMLDRYFEIVADHTARLQRLHKNLVVTQAVYRIAHREYLSSKIPEMEMICITADDRLIVERLIKRGDTVTPDYATQMKVHFQMPPPGAKVLTNNVGEVEIVVQLNAFYGSNINKS